MSILKEKDKNYIVGTYNRFDVAIVSGNGSTCTDEDGKNYIDFTSGIGVNSLGFADSDWANAVAKQAQTMQHISNLYYTKPCVDLAEKLCQITGYSKVFFANSGAEANEGAIKIARKYSFDKYGEGKSKIITLVNSFHGRTITTLAATGQDVFHNFFFPFTEGFVHCEANNITALNELVDDSVCAIMYEPVLGEGGVLDLTAEFAAELKKIAAEKDILLISDEVQTGIGRTGKFLANEHFDLKPDIISLAKGLGGGLPIGAILCTEKTAEVLGYSAHGTTFGGNPVSCAGALVCVEKICTPEFLAEVTKKAEYIKEKLLALNSVKSITGKGLMIGILPTEKAVAEVMGECMKNGLLVLSAKDKVRLLPPLNISYAEIDAGLEILCKALG